MTSTTESLRLSQIDLLTQSIKSFNLTLVIQNQIRNRYVKQLAELHIHDIDDYATVVGDDIDCPYEDIAVAMANVGSEMARTAQLIRVSEEKLADILEGNRKLWIV
ncbi:uncharacterized protein LAJ45_03679 [Morchella importuna]|uniref:uncharacterized protein n=1 Tax=Morchella importuna TaxID=1174673 RepID=UPI001E8E6EDF|nr:uncharacterized protein LAJ45_03679 [Morchella importuna]KAH8152253.1 hypothetical protein LAJ45_03679 [Morchella importuna]